MRRLSRALRRLLAGVLFAFAAQAGWALGGSVSVKDYHHTVWTAKAGAPKDTWSIAQTADGWIWLGGTAGLTRFDGSRFERVDQALDDAERSVAVAALFALPSGGLLIGRLTGGVSLLEQGRFTHFDSPDAQGTGAVIGFAQRPDGSLWAASQAGLLHLVNGAWRLQADTGLPAGHVSAVAADAASTLWVATRDSVHRQRQGQRRFETLDLRLRNVSDFVTGPDGRLWAADDQGVHLLPGQADPAGRSAQANARMSYTALFDREGVLWTLADQPPPPAVRGVRDLGTVGTPKTMMEDREGNLWFGDIEDAIHRIRRPVFHRLAGAPRMGQATPWAGMAVDGAGTLWMAMAYSGGMAAPAVDGLWMLDGALRRVAPERIRSATAIAQNARTHLLVGGQDGLWRRDAGRWVLAAALPPGAERQFVGAVSAEAGGGLWIALEGAGLFRHDGQGWQRNGQVQGLPPAAPTVLLHDPQDRFWLGYADGNVARVEQGQARFLAAQTRHRTGAIRAISVGRHTVFGGDRGLAVLRDGQAIALQPSLAGVFDNVTGLVETDDGDLWVHGDLGVAHIAAAELARAIAAPTPVVVTTLFGEEDGHPGPATHAIGVKPTLAQAGDGKLWVAAHGGIAWLDPREPRRPRTAPPVVLKTLDSQGVRIPLTRGPEVTLPKGTRSLQIDYTALAFSHPDRLRFRYRLEGLEDEWVPAKARREAFYANLGPGRYRFVVNVTDESGVWSDASAALQFDIPPTFVQSRGFMALCLTAALALLFGLHRLRVRQLTARERARLAERLGERERIARALHDTLLQGAQALVLRFDSVARRLPLSPADDGLLRTTLRSAEDMIAEGRDRIQDLRATPLTDGDALRALSTLGQELAQQHGPQFVMHAEGRLPTLPSATEDAVYRVGREALLNAFRHARASQVALHVTVRHHALRLQVCDDGAGLPPEVQRTGQAPGHWGLPGMLEQMERLQGTLHIGPGPFGGTVVDIAVPLADRSSRLRAWWLWRRRAPRAGHRPGGGSPT
ncbi:sensor histidine kinase [Pseudorhodoferax sp.]|uniref:sensor histidine kinase n=1 Tax=Pseudorhodoferax sp. TaxID=1993553 RepID=UPI002DD62B3E|nr:triple tyrosine motif-containing protein [Pseudorhodoferax sp.]